MDGANHIISRLEDICVIAPTGAGKSLLWILPLLAQKQGISLVIVPFTSLGVQGENRHKNSHITATFLSSENCSPEILRKIAQSVGMHVIYTCPEMLETPAVAQVLHCQSFQDQLSGIYIDEAHCVHESLSWRPPYTCLHLLRQVIGSAVPLITLSATLPQCYQDSLVVYAGLHPQYHLINLGNFRSELATVVKHMQHAVNSFLDLMFIIDLANRLSIIIYCDNLETLTAMFWWFYKQLESAQLPCIDGVSNGCVRILLGSDKIGAGMDFPSVGLVVQYQCQGLSIVQWEQRKGHGARCHGLTATGLILVEKSMLEGPNSSKVKLLNSQDPGLLDLVQTKGCLQHCVDKWLENPVQESNVNPCSSCSNCNPDLVKFTDQYIFMLEDFHKGHMQNLVPVKEAEKIYTELCHWRLKLWKLEWKDKLPGRGPESLVSTVDLTEISCCALQISTLDDLDQVASIVHLKDVGPPLLIALHTAVLHICGPESTEDLTSPNVVVMDIPAKLQWDTPENPDTFLTNEVAQQVGRLEYGEQVIYF
ncbi:P-loop containing nucleoside triphosphate hydrolase protein [Cyathus striatus]|nr:P-loop containing nucleoside triphosphate hydrolase protein [Cyathus striatus]